MIRRLFTDHPRSVGETYLEHAGVAGRFGVEMVVAGLACLVHAAVPALFERTASNRVVRLHARMVGRARSPRPLRSPPADGWMLDFQI